MDIWRLAAAIMGIVQIRSVMVNVVLYARLMFENVLMLLLVRIVFARGRANNDKIPVTMHDKLTQITPQIEQNINTLIKTSLQPIPTRSHPRWHCGGYKEWLHIVPTGTAMLKPIVNCNAEENDCH